MIAQVLADAAADVRLTENALRVLIWFGRENTDTGGWDWSPLTVIADYLHMSPLEVKRARHQLLKYGYLLRKKAMIFHRKNGVVIRTERHLCYMAHLAQGMNRQERTA